MSGAPARAELGALPPIIEWLAERTSLETALEFVARFGGRRVYFPAKAQKLTPQHALIAVLGEGAPAIVKELRERFGGRVQIPAIRGALRRIEARRLWREGHSVKSIIRKLNITNSSVKEYCRGMDVPPIYRRSTVPLMVAIAHATSIETAHEIARALAHMLVYFPASVAEIGEDHLLSRIVGVAEAQRLAEAAGPRWRGYRCPLPRPSLFLPIARAGKMLTEGKTTSDIAAALCESEGRAARLLMNWRAIAEDCGIEYSPPPSLPPLYTRSTTLLLVLVAKASSLDVALRIARGLEGQTIYFPRSGAEIGDDHPLAIVAGLKVAQRVADALSGRCGGCRCAMPSPEAFERIAEVARMASQGKPPRKIAAALGISTRQAQAILRKWGNDFHAVTNGRF